MTKWLQSGRRRDVCFLLVGEDGLRGQALKSRLESHYDEHIDPKSFYASLSALVDAGHVEERSEGIHDVYALTDVGADRLQSHYEWVQSRLE